MHSSICTNRFILLFHDYWHILLSWHFFFLITKIIHVYCGKLRKFWKTIDNIKSSPREISTIIFHYIILPSWGKEVVSSIQLYSVVDDIIVIPTSWALDKFWLLVEEQSKLKITDLSAARQNQWKQTRIV